jgi:hypothetical protein
MLADVIRAHRIKRDLIGHGRLTLIIVGGLRSAGLLRRQIVWQPIRLARGAAHCVNAGWKIARVDERQLAGKPQALLRMSRR